LVVEINVLWVDYSVDVHLHIDHLLLLTWFIIIVSTRSTTNYARGCAEGIYHVWRLGVRGGVKVLETLIRCLSLHLISVCVAIDHKSPFLCFVALSNCILWLPTIHRTFLLHLLILFLNHQLLIFKLLLRWFILIVEVVLGGLFDLL
jgi:hypothetical protein